MDRIVFMWFMLNVMVFAVTATCKVWEKDLNLQDYLQKEAIPLSILSNISQEDQKFLFGISTRYPFCEKRDANGTLLQAFIPISKEMQIHLYRNEKKVDFNIIPISYKEDEYFAKITIERNVHSDTFKQTGSIALADRLALLLKHTTDVRRFKKGDTIELLYMQATHMGHRHGVPKILIAKVTQQNKTFWVYGDDKGHGHTLPYKKQRITTTQKKKIRYKKQIKLSGRQSRFLFPLKRVKITSHFSHRRWHPILRRYRPHYGTDFGAKRGTPLRAVHDGVVSFAGWKGGYGKVVQIKHKRGYESLYAHQSRIKVKRGQRVKRGQIIGYVGSTGRSTGPHLHFGMKKNGRWINPLRVLGKVSLPRTITKTVTKYVDVQKVHYKKIMIKDARKRKVRLQKAIKQNTPTYRWDKLKEDQHG